MIRSSLSTIAHHRRCRLVQRLLQQQSLLQRLLRYSNNNNNISNSTCSSKKNNAIITTTTNTAIATSKQQVRRDFHSYSFHHRRCCCCCCSCSCYSCILQYQQQQQSVIQRIRYKHRRSIMSTTVTLFLSGGGGGGCGDRNSHSLSSSSLSLLHHHYYYPSPILKSSQQYQQLVPNHSYNCNYYIQYIQKRTHLSKKNQKRRKNNNRKGNRSTKGNGQQYIHNLMRELYYHDINSNDIHNNNDDDYDDYDHLNNNNKNKNKNRNNKNRKNNQNNQKDLNDRYNKNIGKQYLHPAAKWKRILSACDYWFSKNNLMTDEFLRLTIQQYNGYIPISILITFPKFHYWTTSQLLCDAFTSSGATNRYQLIYNKQLWNNNKNKNQIEYGKKKQVISLHNNNNNTNNRSNKNRHHPLLNDVLSADDILFNDSDDDNDSYFKYNNNNDAIDDAYITNHHSKETTASSTIQSTTTNTNTQKNIWKEYDSDYEDEDDDDDDDDEDDIDVYDGNYDDDDDAEYNETRYGNNGIRTDKNNNNNNNNWNDDDNDRNFIQSKSTTTIMMELQKEYNINQHNNKYNNRRYKELPPKISRRKDIRLDPKNYDPILSIKDLDFDDNNDNLNKYDDNNSDTDEYDDFDIHDDDNEDNDDINDNDEWNDLDFDDDELVDDIDNKNHDNNTKQIQRNSHEQLDYNSDDDNNDDDVPFERRMKQQQQQQQDSYSDNDRNNYDDEDNTKPDVRYAFVRHRRVNLAYIAMIEQEIYQNSLEKHDDSDNDDDDLDYHLNHDEDLFDEDSDNDDIGNNQIVVRKQKSKVEAKEEEVIKKEVIRHKNYGTNRPVSVIVNPYELRQFCSTLVQSAKECLHENDNNPMSYAISFDVEYCSLEMDIRNTLPALIQLAGPKSNSPVGLIWIDKFPMNGRDLLTNTNDYQPLLNIFTDTQLYKVGVSLSNDVINIAQWCGVNNKKDVDYFFSNIVDIEKLQGHDKVRNKSLQEMADAILQRNLPKIKGKRRSLKDRIKRAPTAHWRTNNLTGQMKLYAANDVACAMDVWMKIHNFTSKPKKVTKTTDPVVRAAIG